MNHIFSTIDFQAIKNNPSFKEDGVREMIILPLLTSLGYQEDNIERSKTLRHPFLKVGSKKRPINLIPDYVLKVTQSYAWVLEAKKPTENTYEGDSVEQVYSYATHPEIRSNYFALCNGLEFSLFKTLDTNTPILYFSLDAIADSWQELTQYLAPDRFQVGKSFAYQSHFPITRKTFDYSSRPLLEPIEVKKQQAKRHFGVHGYFTKQAWNVVAEYIKNFSQPGDLILDPFGGSGVTAIEALMNNRKAISIDINPLAIFLVNSLITSVDFDDLSQAFERVKLAYQEREPQTKEEITKALNTYPYPQDLKLPKGSDVATVEQLFSNKQLAQLSLLKHLIKQELNENVRESLLLMFSGLLTKANLTYHNNNQRPASGQGNASVFQYYRYRIAPQPVEIDIFTYFELRLKKIISAKKEMTYFINKNTINRAKIVKGIATNLSFIDSESVDYIYTDPPYGKKIPCLYLSVMWNAWLDLEVTEKDYQLEAIEGGTIQKSKQEYNQLIAQSIQEMYRVLKFERWLSFVFAHKDPEFWHLILDTAESCGFEYVGAVPQKNGQTSFKKRQNPFTVLSGQLIINFRKVPTPKAVMKANLGMDITEIVMQTVEGIIAKNDGANLEQLNDELIIKGLELGFLDLLAKEYSDLTPILLDNFDYDEKTELYTIKKDSKFKSKIDVKLRIKYYLISYLRRMERDNKSSSFDDIVFNI